MIGIVIERKAELIALAISPRDISTKFGTVRLLNKSQCSFLVDLLSFFTSSHQYLGLAPFRSWTFEA